MLRSGTRGGEGESSVHDWFLSSTSHSRIIWDRPNRQIEGIGYVSNGEERKSVSGRHGERECDLEPKRFYIDINMDNYGFYIDVNIIYRWIYRDLFDSTCVLL